MALEVVPCVHGAVDLRSTRDGPEDEVLHCSAAEWAEFLAAAKEGKFDNVGSTVSSES